MNFVLKKIMLKYLKLSGPRKPAGTKSSSRGDKGSMEGFQPCLNFLSEPSVGSTLTGTLTKVVSATQQPVGE